MGGTYMYMYMYIMLSYRYMCTSNFLVSSLIFSPPCTCTACTCTFTCSSTVYMYAQLLRQGKVRQLRLRTTPLREKEELPQVGFEPATYVMLPCDVRECCLTMYVNAAL